jgi:hypothetical protein
VNRAGSDSPASLKHEALCVLRAMLPLESLYMLLRRSGLRQALAQPGIEHRERLAELLEQLRRTEQELDWEMTGELVRLKDLLQERTQAYAQRQYGISLGGHIRLPNALAGVPEKVRVESLELVDDAEYDLKVTGNPVRADGSVGSDRIDLLVGPEGVKVRVPDAPKRDQLRSRVHK